MIDKYPGIIINFPGSRSSRIFSHIKTWLGNVKKFYYNFSKDFVNCTVIL